MGKQGEARWATPRDLKAGGLFKRSGVFLGTDPTSGKHLSYGGASHIFTLAPPDTGKTAAIAIPSLLENPASMVVTDPKGALTAQTARHRRENLGHRIVVLNPFRDELTTDLGQDLGDTGFNPLHGLKAGDPSIIDNAEMLASLICPTPHSHSDPVWTQTGADVLTGLILFMVYHEDYTCTLPELYNLVRLVDDDGWAGLAARMMKVSGIDLEAYVSTIQENLKSEKQWAGVVLSLHNATKIYNPQKALARHVSRNEFDPDDLKREKVTVYIVVPNKYRKANEAWLGLVVGMFAEAVGKAGITTRVTFLCEEFQNLGFLPSIGRAMAEYREAGLQVHLIVQTLKELRQIYSRDGADALTDLCSVKQYFGIVDLELAENLQRSIGTYTTSQTSQNVQRERFKFDVGEMIGLRPSKSAETTSEIGVPLLRAQDALNLGNGEQIILIGGATPPIKARLHYYFNDPAMMKKVDPNPYRPKEAASPMRWLPSWHTLGNIGMIALVLIGFVLLSGAMDGDINRMLPYLIAAGVVGWLLTSPTGRVIGRKIGLVGLAGGIWATGTSLSIGWAVTRWVLNLGLLIGFFVLAAELLGLKEPVLIFNLMQLYNRVF